MSFPRYPAYKPSGVEWLGEVPEHWEVLPLKREFAVVGGSTPRSDTQDYWDGDIQWITPADLSRLQSFEITESIRTITADGLNSCGATMVPIGSVVVSTRAPIGSLGIAGIELCTNQGCKALVPNDQISPSFTAYFLGIATEALNVRGRGATFLEISGDELGAFKVALPPYQEQVQIAKFLDRETAKIDTLIAEQQRLIELMQEKRQAVISHAVTKGLNPKAPMKDSGVEWLGKVPDHWEVLPCRAFLNERDERNNDYRSDYYLSLVAGRGVIPYDEKGDIGNKKPEDLGKCKHVREGDFVINSMNYGIGSYGVSRYDGVCSPVYIVVTPIEARTRPGFAFRVLENKWFQQYAQSFGNGILAHRCAIGWDVLKNIKAGLPPENEQLDILRYLDEQTSRFESLIAEAEKQVNLLKERRSALISAAVTGQIDVRGLVTEANPA